MNKVAETLDVAVKPAIKLIELVSKAIGTLYEPHKIKKMADAEAYRIGVIGKAISDNVNLPMSYSKDGLTIDITNFNEFESRAINRVIQQEVKRQRNIESIADEAYDILKDDISESGEVVSDDWMTKFVSYAQDVSDEDMKKIWAKILAEEVKKPKSFSKRTLSILCNLSKEEALIFGKCSSLKINGYIPNEIELLKKYGIKYGDILDMDDCGLLNSDGFIGSSIELESDDDYILLNDELLLKVKGEKGEILEFQQFPFTASGLELCSITGQQLNVEFAIEYAKIVQKKNETFTFSLHKVNYAKNNKIDYDDKNLLDQ